MYLCKCRGAAILILSYCGIYNILFWFLEEIFVIFHGLTMWTCRLVTRWNTLHLLAKGLRGRVSQCNELPKDYDNACLNGMQHV